jgi:choline dehydrogenase-like flavoprotein
MNMGKVLGGGSSINAMSWVRGHKTDWNFFASETGDMAWNYESVKRIYRRIEDWGGEPDTEHRGTGGTRFCLARSPPADRLSHVRERALDGDPNLRKPEWPYDGRRRWLLRG